MPSRPRSRSVPDSLRDSLQRALGDGYRVERELGGGGMSRVFVARDLALDRDVVVKVLSRDATEGVSRDRFRREIQVIARLQHPHIVSILSAGEADGALYYLMPFIAGESLRARLVHEGPLAVSDAVRILREILDALAFAHKHGVIHRDIKPENVLIEAGHCVVADFGIAKALRESGTMTSSGVALGTPAYMAPEQATADPATDHRADLYAVGVLAYELLTGWPPFSGSAQQIITAHLTTPAPVLRDRRSDVPAPLSDLVRRALAKDPAERPQSASEMLTALEAVATPAATSPGVDAAAVPAPATTTPVAPTRRRGPRVPIAAALVIAIAVFLQFGRDRPPAPVVAEGADVIAVMPLGAVSDTSLTRLGQDLVVTLSTNLDGVGSLRTVDAVTLLMRARQLPSPIPLQDAQRLAQQLGARSVMTGTLITEGNRVRATVTLHAAATDSLLARATALAAPNSIAELTDSLTWSILQQVWRRGSAPSPVLTGLTTPSFDALRAFLDGERHFQRLDIARALAAYRHAFELDSNFAQAFLRHDYVNAWNLQPRDAFVHNRLLALANRLPERERLWLQTRESSLPVPQQVTEWRTLVRRYPDYPPVLMSAADVIIHTGPLYGISLAEAQPLLDRLNVLVPDHADTKFHQALVAMRAETDSAYIAAMDAAGRAAAPPWGRLLLWMSEIRRARATGQPPPPAERAYDFLREMTSTAAADPIYAFATGIMGYGDGDSRYRLEVLEQARQDGVFGALLDATAYGEGLLRIARGDWTRGIAVLGRAERATADLAFRLTAARLAAIGAWLGAVPAGTADSTVRRARLLLDSEAMPSASTIEWHWSDGLVGVAQGDDARVRAAVHEISSIETAAARHAARSLTGLRLAHTDPDAGADSVKAVSDQAMHAGGFLLPVEAVNRFVVARALRRRGAPAEAERYLMFVDAGVNTASDVSVTMGLASLVAYERGVALDDAGNRTAAARHLRAFVDDYDQPLPAFAALVDDARQRLARLEPGDTPMRPKAVGPGR